VEERDTPGGRGRATFPGEGDPSLPPSCLEEPAGSGLAKVADFRFDERRLLCGWRDEGGRGSKDWMEPIGKKASVGSKEEGIFFRGGRDLLH
jgi:hypothetical protein